MKFVYEKGAKVSDLVKKHNADYGFNFPFVWGSLPLGNVYDGKRVISKAYGKMLNWTSFCWYQGKPIIGRFDINPNTDFQVQGGPLLIENGRLVYEFYAKYDQTANDIIDSECQRTAVGIDGDGNFLVVVTDGRTVESKGLSISELANFMKFKDCVTAINADGGGSSVLVDKNGIVNNITGGVERTVHHAMLVYVK